MKPGKETTAEVKKTTTLSKENAQETMKKHGYNLVASSGTGNVLFFNKMLEGEEWNGAGVHAKVSLDKEQVELSFVDLQYTYTLNSNGFAIDHEGFNKFEKILIEYARILVGVDPLSKITKKLKPIKERKDEFWAKIVPLAKKKGMSKEETMFFFRHWIVVKEGGRKMWFERQDTFDISLRLDNWKRNEKKWSKTFVSEKAEQQNDLIKVKKIVKKKDIF